MKNHLLKGLLLLTTIAGSLATASAQGALTQRLTTESNILMTVSNIGVIGNAFRGVYTTQNYPSCQFPRRSNIEHLFQGGLWVGALKGTDSTTIVATGAFDASAGYVAGAANFEFTAPLGTTLRERSSLRTKGSLFSPNAISHQDFLGTFVDTNLIVPGTNRQQTASSAGQATTYVPLGISVESEIYNWNFSFSNFFVVLNYKIKNVSNATFFNPYVGYWCDPVIRNVAITPPGGTPFFSAGGTGYIDSLYAGYEFDAGGDTSTTRSYFAIKYLGGTDPSGFRHTPFVSPFPLNDSFKVHFNTWNFNSPSPIYFQPQSELERYFKLANGLEQRSDWDIIQTELKVPFNRSLFISAGPFDSIAPGQTIEATFAVVCARQLNDGRPVFADTPLQRLNLINNLRWVQTAYAGNDKDFDGMPDDSSAQVRRFILPTPPDIPFTRVEAADGKVDIYWSNNSEASLDPISQDQDFEGYRLYISKLGFDTELQPDLDSAFQVLAQYDTPGNNLFFDTDFEPVRLPSPVFFDGDTNAYHYKYTIDNVQNGWQQVVAVTSFDRGDSTNNLGSLETNPTANMFRVFPGTRPNENIKEREPFVYPNPYYGTAAWEGLSSASQQDKKLMFANLPARCKITIFSSSGDLIDQFEHNQAYRGESARWYQTFSDPNQAVFSGGEHAWDLLSRNTQIIARGLYLFSVEDLDSGESYNGRFVIIK